jgi:isopentenyl phosphate kinase
MVTVLKLGGSLITEKETPETVDEDALSDACDAIAAFLAGEDGHGTAKSAGDTPRELVLVHGGGSFGHHHAAKYGLSSTEGTHSGEELTTVHRAMGRLNERVVDELHDRGVDALPVRPLSVASRDDGLTFEDGPIEAMLEEGFVPVTHGDVVVDRGRGGTILSGDDIVVSLASSLAVDRVGLCSTVPGVLDDDGTVIKHISSYDDVAPVLGESEATDVTGGMAHKVKQLLALDSTASIFDGSALARFLSEGRAGTVVHGGSEN